MSTTSSTIVGLAIAALAAGGAAFAISRTAPTAQDTPAQKAAAAPVSLWTASAPGRIEPRRGEIRISAQAAGRIVEIAVSPNEKVVAGDVLVRLDDEDYRNRVAAADAEAAVRRRERDEEKNIVKLAQDRRQADDNAAAAERAHVAARAELDRLVRAKRTGDTGVTEEAIKTARTALVTAGDKLEAERAALRRTQSASGVPLPTRLEAGLTAARVDLSLAEAALERTRVRAPSDGTVLQVLPRVGEHAAPSPEQTLIVLGDLEALRVRAEVEERDVAKVRVGQAVAVKTDGYPGREFSGRVTSLARTLAPGKLAQRGPRRPNDLDSLEVMIDLDPATELLSGMRVDVFFKADPVAAATPAAAPPPASK